MGVLTSALNKLEETAIDFSTLSVTTYNGDLKVMLSAGQRTRDDDADSSISVDNLDFQKILDSVLNGQVDGQLQVAYMNIHNIDGDAVVFANSSLPAADMAALKPIHEAALTAGRETREGILTLVKDILK